MKFVSRFENMEQAESALLEALAQPDWKRRLCTNREGELEQLYTDMETTYKIAGYTPCGMFSSREDCDEYLKQDIAANARRIATMMLRGGPLRRITTRHDHVVGQYVQLQEDGSFSVTPACRTAMMVSRNKNDTTGLGVFISSYGPVV